MPCYTNKVVDDGASGVLQLTVDLPGIASADEIDLRVFQRSISLRAPGKYRLVRGSQSWRAHAHALSPSYIQGHL